MRNFINIVTEHRESNLPKDGIKQGEFVQEIGWFGDVWAYVASAYEKDGDRQTVSYIRRDGKGKMYQPAGRKPDPTTMAIYGHNVKHERGSLMSGMQRCNLRKVATKDELKALLAAGHNLIIAFPDFKCDWGQIWRDGVCIGTYDRNGVGTLSDGREIDIFEPNQLS